MMSHKSILKLFLILSILMVFLQPSSSQSELEQDDTEIEIVEPQWFLRSTISPSYSSDIVAEFEALTSGLELPDHMMTEDAEKSEGDFDVSLYFTVQDQLSMERGRVLDYVYDYAGIGGSPVLYARKASATPYRNYSEYLAADAAAEPEEREDYYLKYVASDGTPEGFFQLALLLIQGEQFYLFWHANYNDDQIVSDQEGARTALADLTGWVGENESTTEGLLAEVSEIDLTPVVSMNQDLVKVEVVVFTKWGGFVKRSIVMEREFPHLIQWERSEVLVPYNCGIMF
jgi:hypothetical protein